MFLLQIFYVRQTCFLLTTLQNVCPWKSCWSQIAIVRARSILFTAQYCSSTHNCKKDLEVPNHAVLECLSAPRVANTSQAYRLSQAVLEKCHKLLESLQSTLRIKQVELESWSVHSGQDATLSRAGYKRGVLEWKCQRLSGGVLMYQIVECTFSHIFLNSDVNDYGCSRKVQGWWLDFVVMTKKRNLDILGPYKEPEKY